MLIEIAEANVADLAALLGCSLFDAAQEKRLCAIGVLPYLASRITPEVIKQFNGIFLNIIEGKGELGGIGVAAAVLDRVEYTTVAAEPGEDGEDGDAHE